VTPLDPSAALATEWLLANALGGYAMGTALGANTRRYHGLLVAAAHPPVDRVLALHSVVEQLVRADGPVDLSTHRFGDEAMLHPQGWRRLATFDAEPATACRWTFREGDVTVTRRVTLRRGSNLARVAYSVRGAAAGDRLTLRPLTPLRDVHELRRAGSPAPEVTAGEDGLHVRHGPLTLRLAATAGGWRIAPEWWRDFAYPGDRERGQAWREDVWSPGVLEVQIGAGGATDVTIEAHLPGSDDPDPRPARAPGPARLPAASDQFVVRRRGETGWETSIIAGYPWFADWGRDAMISRGAGSCPTASPTGGDRPSTTRPTPASGSSTPCTRAPLPTAAAISTTSWPRHGRSSRRTAPGRLTACASTTTGCWRPATARRP
jgi:glycogen debranching enzyme